MKVLKKGMVTIFFVYIGVSVTLCHACCLDEDIKQLKKNIRQESELMPNLLQAVDDLSLDAENPQGRELQQFVTQVSAPALNLFNQVFTLVLANPWMEQATKPLVQEIYTSNPELRYKGANQAEQYEKMKRFMSLYRQKLNEHHPRPCLTCKGGLLQKPGRCQFMHEEYETMRHMLDVLLIGAEIESRDPDVGSKYQALRSDVREGNTAPAKHTVSKYRKMDAEPKECAILETKTAD